MIKGAAKAIDYYKKAFNAVELFRIAIEDGSIIHAEITIEGSIIMLGGCRRTISRTTEA